MFRLGLVALAMKATAREVVADFRGLYPDGDEFEGHRDVRPAGTDCPGPAAYAALERGEFTPGAPTGDTPTPPTKEDDMWNTAEAEKIEKRYVLAHQLWLSQTAAEQAMSNALAGKLLAEGKTPAEANAEVEKIWAPVQRIHAEALARLT
jgi:hypothetical protein